MKRFAMNRWLVGWVLLLSLIVGSAQGDEAMQPQAPLNALFAADLAAYQGGVGPQKPRNEHGAPFLLIPDHPNGAGVVLAHGFTGSPWEMRLLGARLVQEGFTVYGVRLPGHGTSPEDLKACTWPEWVEVVDAAATALHSACDRVYGVGLSTGGLAVLYEAATQPAQFRAIAALSPALIHRSKTAWLANYVSWLKEEDVRPLTEEEKPFYYERRPLKAIAQLNDFQKAVREVLGQIKQPILVMQSRDDGTIDPESSEVVLRSVASKQRLIHWFPAESKVPHVLTTAENPRLEEALDQVARFLKEQENSER
ncbi:MAG: hypothetical protein COX57_03130 [Alphaproteobacteria bacterium CG_4_10_14_0_2_um_filter_63_37]|nr:MAG: hypothetical protein COX57_03130 [Alphaproteobacteria bacterium CG_4_10_14_0_2_um_filter_63_37]